LGIRHFCRQHSFLFQNAGYDLCRTSLKKRAGERSLTVFQSHLMQRKEPLMANEGYPERTQEPLEDEGLLAESQSGEFGAGEEDVLAENLQTDVSDVAERGGRATVGRSQSVEERLESAGMPTDNVVQGRGTQPGNLEEDELDVEEEEMSEYLDPEIERYGLDMGEEQIPGG
jgi:hypothetical protein